MFGLSDDVHRIDDACLESIQVKNIKGEEASSLVFDCGVLRLDCNGQATTTREAGVDVGGEALDVERAIAWRAADLFAVREFLGLVLPEAPPDHRR